MMLRHAGRSLVAPNRQVFLRRPAAASPRLQLPRFTAHFSFATTAHQVFNNAPRFLRAYLNLLHNRPVITKSVTAATIYFLADATSQGVKSDETKTEWDAWRSARMMAAGLLLSGPTLHLWFNLMSRSFPSRGVGSTLSKMALGQLVYGPIFNSLFFSFNAYMQGETTSEVVSRLKRDLLPALKNGLMYWPICDFLTYRYVPVHLQPLVNNCFAYLWTIYLTSMASLKKETRVTS